MLPLIREIPYQAWFLSEQRADRQPGTQSQRSRPRQLQRQFFAAFDLSSSIVRAAMAVAFTDW
jgi:hypothetical protein